jgi:peptidyl-prolyl cis-trans isomerase D
MQIIQSIREKGAIVIIVVIALCLFGFILMDSKQSNNQQLFGCSSTQEVGKINGRKIERDEYFNKVAQIEEQSGQRPTGAQLYQIRDQAWTLLVAEDLIYKEAGKVGISFTDKELSYFFTTEDPSNPLTQDPSLKDSLTNKLDPQKVKQAFANIKKMKKEEKERIYKQLRMDQIPFNMVVKKYSSLLFASVSYPDWMKEQDQQEENNFANISYVTIPYNEISDSTVKVTDEDVKDYVSKNKELFKQEAGRSISYIAFSKSPSKEDSSKVRAELEALIVPFQTDSTPQSFVAKNLSTIEFSELYAHKSKLSPAVADTLAKLSVNSVYGPYIDKGNYIIAKMLGIKSLPDSAKAKHILIAPKDPQTGKDLYSDADAKKLADSLLAEINNGANFDSLAAKYSADESNKMKGGDLGMFAYGTMVPEFNDFCFEKTPGSKAVVKTDFGYHIINLISQTAPQSTYKIAYVNREIVPSDETINKAIQDATLAATMRDKKSLEKHIAKSGLSLNNVPTPFTESAYQIGGLMEAREIVRWAFEAKPGEVSDKIFNVGEQAVVVVLDKAFEKGTQDVATARLGCEAIIRNKKKAEQIIKKLGNNPTLESAAAAYSKTVMIAGADSTLTFSSSIVNGVGMEQKLIGASFNKAYQNKVSPVFEGTTGVFIMKVNSIGTKQPMADPAKDVESKLSALKNTVNGWYESLNKQADIVDNRLKFY